MHSSLSSARPLKRRLPKRAHALSCAALLVCIGFAQTSTAEIYSLSGELRLQIGSIPFPITFAAPPVGRVKAIPAATIRQFFRPTGPPNIVLNANQLTESVNPVNFPYALINPNLLQLHTALSFGFPRATVAFQEAGRTGPPTLTVCPPLTLTGPACPATPPVGVVRYTRTSRQFGGPARGLFGGQAEIALPAAAPPPCAGSSCLAIFAQATPANAFGGPFGFASAQVLPPPSPGLFSASVAPAGTIQALGAPFGPGLTESVQSFAGPWTTGMVTVSVPGAIPPQLIVLTGNDGRTPAGQGTISLVSGGLVQSLTRGPNATLGRLTLTIGPAVSGIPMLPAAGVGALGALTVASGLFALRRRSG